MQGRNAGRVWVLVAAVAAGAGRTGFAEEEAQQALPDMVVSANRYETPAGNVGSSVTVLDADDIRRTQQANALEVLRGVGSVEVTQSGGPGRLADVAIRGASSSQTLVLVDGVRVNAATLGAFDFAGLGAENIERIEVLRGPQSTLYGSEAMGGVISITTRRGARGAGGNARVEGGDPEQWLGAAEVHGGNDAGDYSAAASWQEYNGLSAADESVGGTEDDDFRNLNASGRVGLNVTDDGRADVTFRYFNSDADVDGFDGMRVADDPNATTEREGLAAGASLRQAVNAWWAQTLAGGVYDETLEGEDPDSPFNVYKIDNRNIDASAQSDLTPIDDHVVSVGYAFEDRQGEARDGFDENADIHSVFGQDQWNPIEALYLTGGARLDEHSEFGSEGTYRGTASYAIPATWLRLHGSAGTGFKAPTLTDLYFPNFGNPELDPETSVGYDAGVEVRCPQDRMLLDVTLFRTTFDDLISFDSTTFVAENIHEAEVQGVEVSGRFRVCTNAQVGASYTYTDSENETTGQPLPRRPEHRVTLQTWYQPVARITTSAALVAVNDRIDSDGSAMDDYERIDLTAEYALNTHIHPYVRVENLLDQDYEEVNGFSAPGFTGVGGVRAVW